MIRWKLTSPSTWTGQDTWFRIVKDMHQEPRKGTLVWVNHFDLERFEGKNWRHVSNHSTLTEAKKAGESWQSS